MARFFLDTSAHVERWGGDEQSRSRIEDLLGDEQHATSSHALREWKGIVDRSCADFLNLLREGQVTTLRELLARVGRGYGRKPGHRTLVLAMLVGDDQTLSAPAIAIRADQWRRFMSSVAFRRQIDEVRDGSNCGLAREIVMVDERSAKLTLKTTCKKDDSICRQDDDLGDKIHGLRDASDALRGSPDSGHRAVGRIGLAAASTPRDRKGKNCWQYLGDLSIALECRDDETILTTDASFDHIAPVLGRSVMRLPTTAGP